MHSTYLTKHSTEKSILKIINDILLSLDSGKGVILVHVLVLLNLSTAFDTISHEMLASRLQPRIQVDGPAHNWFRSYLQDQYQVVSIDGSSDCVLIIYSMPQGSFLGLVKFLMHMVTVYNIALSHGIVLHHTC